MKSRLPALALAIALPLTTVQIVDAPLVAAQSTSAIPQETEKRARLAAQAIEELINEYRVANGLHPLVTHELYDARALAWSEQMVADLKTLGYPKDDADSAEDGNTEEDDGSAFRHSDPEEWGHSGENIVFDNGVVDHETAASAPELRGDDPFQDTEADWARVATILFEDWRNSPSHNANMLAPQFQGMGLGLVLNDKGEVWGTTMFFIDGTPLQNSAGEYANGSRDAVTQAALASGIPFYVPSGARDLLGVSGVENPKDTKGYEITRFVDYGEYGMMEVIPRFDRRTGPSSWDTYTLDKSQNAPRALDPAVTGIEIQKSQAEKTTTPAPAPSSATPTSSAATTTPATSPAPQSTAPATSTTPVVTTPVASTTAAVITPAVTTTSSAEAPTSTTAQVTTEPSTPASITSATSAKAATPTSATAKASTTAPTTTSDVNPTGGQGSVDKQSPAPKPTETTTSTTTSKEPKPVEPNPKDEGSSKAGIAIGVVLALLAVVGAAAAALPMVAPDLARQLGIPGA